MHFLVDPDEGWRRETVHRGSVLTADGLAVDWVYSHLYWTDTGSNTVAMSDLKGRMTAVLVKDDLQEPRAIALHPEKGFVPILYIYNMYIFQKGQPNFFGFLHPNMLIICPH